MKLRINFSALKNNARATKSTNVTFAATALTEKDLEKAMGGVSYVTKALHDNHYQYSEAGTVVLRSRAAAC